MADKCVPDESLRYFCFQVGSMAHIRQSLKVWSLVESVITIGIITGIAQTTAVTGVTILESGTVGLSSCMSYKSHLVAIFVTVVTASGAGKLSCFASLSKSVNNQSSINRHHQSSNKV